METIIKINDEYFFENGETYVKMEPLYIERNVWKNGGYHPEMVLEWHCWDTRDWVIENGTMVPVE